MTHGRWEVLCDAGSQVEFHPFCRSPPPQDQRQTGGSAGAAWQCAAECAKRHFSKSEVSPPFPRNNALVFVSFYLSLFVPLNLAARRLFCPPSLRLLGKKKTTLALFRHTPAFHSLSLPPLSSPPRPSSPLSPCLLVFPVPTACLPSVADIAVHAPPPSPRPHCHSLFLLFATKPQLHFLSTSFPSGFLTSLTPPFSC